MSTDTVAVDREDYSACGKPIEVTTLPYDGKHNIGVCLYCDLPADHEQEFHHAELIWHEGRLVLEGGAAVSTDTVAADRGPAMNFQHVPGCQCEVEGAPYDNARDSKCVNWDKIMRRWLVWHDAKVRDEHAERIVAAIEAKRDAIQATAEGVFDDHVRDLTDREVQGMNTALESCGRSGSDDARTGKRARWSRRRVPTHLSASRAGSHYVGE